MPQYQGVWTLEAQAQAQSNQQWVTDPNFKNTTLLLQADGTGSGSQNQTFLDGSTNNFAITRFGNTTQGSFSPFSQAEGYWSNYFNGSSSLITPTSSATPLALGSGDFTIEFWVNSAIPGSDVGILENRAADGSSTGLGIGIGGSTGKIRLYSNAELFNAGVITANQFTHVAIVRSGSTGTVYINGISAGTISSWSTNFTDQGFKIGIGAGGNAMTGYISNFRLVKGTAVYTANFTPTTAPLTAITNTSLLTCQSNRFVDNSTNGYAITVNGGTPSVQAFGPFAPALQWTPDVVGGSGYFDGTGDYLTVGSGTDVDLGTSDFMIEFWYYCLANGTYASGVISKRVGGAASGWGMTTSGFVCDMAGTWYDSWALPFWVGSTQNSGFNSGTSLQKLNQWTHVVVTRQGTDARWFVNGQMLGYFSRTGAISQLTGSPLAVGLNGTTAEQPFNGYISNCRVIVGSVPTGYQTSSTTLNTQIFTPPTAPITTTSQGATSGNIKYLGNFTNAGIYDGKMGNVFETTGTAQVATSPVKYGSGSMYFNGSTGYLKPYYSGPANGTTFSFGTGDFTIEFWMYPTSLPSAGMLMDGRGSGASGDMWLLNFNSGVANWYVAGNLITSSAIS